MYNKALQRRNKMTHTAKDFNEFKNIAENEVGFIKAMWCGDEKCEKTIKNETAFTSRCIKDDKGKITDRCVVCEKKSKHLIYWAKSY